MKKYILVLLMIVAFIAPSFALSDKSSYDYLKNKKHLSLMNPVVEKFAEKAIKKSLKKKIGNGRYKIKFDGYTLGSMKKGIFKNLEIIGKNMEIEDIEVPYLKLKSETDYNWIDYKENPIKIKSDITFAYNLELSEKSIDLAIKHDDYKNTLKKLNKKAYPLFQAENVDVKIRNDKLYIIMEYTLPLSSNNKKKTFVISSNLMVENGKIKVSNVTIDKRYGNIPLDKVVNLVNLLDPLNFTLMELNEQSCKSQVKNVKIENDIVKIDGIIYVRGE